MVAGFYCVFRWVLLADPCWWWSLGAFVVGAVVQCCEELLDGLAKKHLMAVVSLFCFVYVLASAVAYICPSQTPVVSECPYVLLGPFCYLVIRIFGGGCSSLARRVGESVFGIYLVHGVVIELLGIRFVDKNWLFVFSVVSVALVVGVLFALLTNFSSCIWCKTIRPR